MQNLGWSRIRPVKHLFSDFIHLDPTLDIYVIVVTEAPNLKISNP